MGWLHLAFMFAIAVLVQKAYAESERPDDLRDLIIQTQSGVDSSKFISDLGLKGVNQVPSLDVIQVQISIEDIDNIRRRLETDSRVKDWDVVRDYRELFDPLDETLLSARAKNKVMQLRRDGRNVRVVRLAKESFTTQLLEKGLGKSDGFQEEGSLVLNVLENQKGVTAVRLDSNLPSGTRWTGKTICASYMPPPCKEGRAAGTVFLSARGDKVWGRITVGNRLFVIEPLGGRQHALIERVQDYRTSRYPEPKRINNNAALRKSVSNEPRMMTVSARSPTTTSNLRVGVVYAPGAVEDIFDGDIQSHANALMDLLSSTFVLSGVTGSTTFAGASQIDFEETQMANDIDELAGNGGAARFAGIHSWRASVSADVVVIVTARHDVDGYAAVIGATATDAFAVISTWASIGDLAFPHEIGHLFGAGHPICQNGSVCAIVPYGHGFVSDDKRCTIMAISSSDCLSSEPIWSGTRNLIFDPPLGNAESADSTRLVEERIPVVADFVQ